MTDYRSFSKDVVLTDKFLQMPVSTQCVYYVLGMSAQNKGILNNAVSLARVAGGDEVDINILCAYGYLRRTDDGYAIVHWYENNGIGETAKKRNNYEYRKWRKGIIDRDKVCQRCGSKKNLEVHHIVHFADAPELRLCDSNGVTLCRKCHRKLHKEGKHGTKTYV